MARPVYETAKHRENEAVIAKRLESFFRCNLIEAPRLAGADFLAKRDDENIALIECKARTITWDKIHQWGGYMISSTKFKRMSDVSAAHEVPAMLAVMDKTNVLKCCCWLGNDLPLGITNKIGGRTDRNDKRDLEDCCYIPTARFNWRIP